MTLPPALRKGLLTVHITFSVGWVGAVLVYVALGVWAVRASDPTSVAAAWSSMEQTGWAVIVPLAGGSLVTGVLVAVGSPWGLVRHYWVLFALVLTVLCLVVLMLHMPSVTALAEQARSGSSPTVAAARGDLPHPSIGLLLLLFVTVLNVYKPRGLTPWAGRQGRQGRRASGADEHA